MAFYFGEWYFRIWPIVTCMTHHISGVSVSGEWQLCPIPGSACNSYINIWPPKYHNVIVVFRRPNISCGVGFSLFRDPLVPDVILTGAEDHYCLRAT